MIVPSLVGQLGNNLFQIATAIAHARNMNTEYRIPDFTRNRIEWPLYITHLPQITREEMGKIRGQYREPLNFQYQPIPPFTDGILYGYFQTELHFKDHRDEVLEALQIPIVSMEKYVSIHVRLTDYMHKFPDKHPPITVDYINRAMELFDGYTPLVFSDDLTWCRENLKHLNAEYCEIADPVTAMGHMAGCTHHIIANSTFSWWGAWIDSKSDKVVVAPRVWFGKGNAHLKTDWIIPKDWIVL